MKTWISEFKVKDLNGVKKGEKAKEKKPSMSTKQIAFASVRSFFEMNYLPLKMRHGDYPTGESLGSRVNHQGIYQRKSWQMSIGHV